MNYLAHLYFSDAEPEAWAGSLMGDFVKGTLDDRNLPPQLLRHLRLHRRIDSHACDSAPFQRSRRRIDPRFGHGRSVMVDVFYDHLLAANWQSYHPRPLALFSREVYAGLRGISELLAPGLQRILPHMTAHDWLLSYGCEEVVQRVLQRLEERLGGRLSLAAGHGELRRLRPWLEEDFQAFMVQTRSFVAQWKRENP